MIASAEGQREEKRQGSEKWGLISTWYISIGAVG